MSPPSKHQLLKKINESKEILFKDKGFRDMCEEYSVSPNIIHLIPIRFGDIDTSAKTKHGIIILNEKLLDKGSFENHIHYILHEILHFLQMITRKEPTKVDEDEEYLDNEDELEAFQYQVEFMGENKGEEYVEDLLDHHDVDDDEWDDKKDELLERFAKITKNFIR